MLETLPKKIDAPVADPAPLCLTPGEWAAESTALFPLRIVAPDPEDPESRPWGIALVNSVAGYVRDGGDRQPADNWRVLCRAKANYEALRRIADLAAGGLSTLQLHVVMEQVLAAAQQALAATETLVLPSAAASGEQGEVA